MIHPSDTVFAYSTVMCSGRPVHLTSKHRGDIVIHGHFQGGLLGADGPVLLGRHAAPVTVTVREVNPVTGQRNNAWV